MSTPPQRPEDCTPEQLDRLLAVAKAGPRGKSEQPKPVKQEES